MTGLEPLNYTRAGTGEPLLLIHGLGDDCRTWNRVLPFLSQFDVIAVDLPGHGRSARIPEGVTPTLGFLRDRVIGLLDELGIEQPHVAGNSLGGWLALELGRVDRARSLTLLCPAGLFARPTPASAKIFFIVGRTLLAALQPFSGPLLRTRIGRTAFLATFSAHPAAVPAETAATIVSALAGSTGFYKVRAAAQNTRFEGGHDICAPVTVAFGTKDRLLTPAHNQDPSELPGHAVWSPLPECGHVPMLDNPRLVADTICATVARAARPGDEAVE